MSLDRQPDTPPIDDTARARRLLVIASLSIFFIVLIRTAWVCDDAFITFRTIDNFVHGYGLRWNVDERVQTYTHPLWMFLVAAFYRFTGEPYFTSLAISMALSLGAVLVVVTRIAVRPGTAWFAATALLLSRAFVDYSTSGLENPLTHFLLAVFFAVYFSDRPEDRRIGLLALLTTLLMVNRLDTGLLVLPALSVAVWARRSRLTVIKVGFGFLPLLAWEVFSLVYYGFPFPNTAYAKLQTGVAAGELFTQGLLYLASSLSMDPPTLVTIAATAIVGLACGDRRTWAILAGVAVYVCYTLRIGGDFMSGRLLAAPFLCAVIAATQIGDLAGDVPMAAASLSIVLLSLAAPHPTLLSDARAGGVWIEPTGINDERLYYYATAGLLRMPREGPWLPPEDALKRAAHDWGKKSTIWGAIGVAGYGAGPTTHVIDFMGLGDPLLARLPARADWRIGHYRRDVPVGYPESIETGTNQIREPAIAALYDQIRLITEGPVWSWSRLRAIVKMNLR